MTDARDRDRTQDDLPTIAANIIATIPPLVLRIGVGYLTMKRRVRKSARAMEAELMASGMPEHLARRLSLRFEEDSKFMETMMKSFMSRRTPTKSWTSSKECHKTGN